MSNPQSSTATASASTATEHSLTNGVSFANINAGGNNERKRLFITHVDSLGPYLKICGHFNPDAMGVVRNQVQKILTTCYTIDSSWPVARQLALLLPGAMCLYKRINGAAPADFEFVRSRILKVVAAPSNAPPTTTPKVDIEIIDYGEIATVASVQLLFPQNPEQMLNIPAMCSQYIVLGICGDWKKSQLDEISRMIAHHSVEVSIEKEFNQFKFITMKWKEFNIAEFLIHQKKMGAPIANDLLFEKFSKILKQQQQQQVALNNNNVPTPNMNSNINNNNNYYNKERNPPLSTSSSTSSVNNANSNNNILSVAQAAAKAASAISAAPPQSSGSANNQMREQMAAGRSLSGRLQQLQNPQLYQPLHMHSNVGHISAGHMIIAAPIQPRMPQSIGNLRSMMQGIHLQNNRIPHTGTHYQPQSQQQHRTHHHHNQQPPPPLPVASIMTAAGGSFNTIPSVMPTTVPHFNNYNPRYQRPQHPTQLSAINMPQQQTTLSPSRRSSPATFKSNSLSVGQVYDVSVSFVENGPFLFSVQLVTQQDDLTDMMNQIEKVHLKQFCDKPMLGTACIARYSEDGQLYRALITGVQPTACKVAYIDYGNAELVHFRDLYEIPDDFLRYKAFAIRFTLSGHKELEPVDDSLKKAFKDLVLYKNCKLKVMPLEGPPLVQYCELYLQEKNILHVLRQIQKTRLVYAKAEPLRNNDIVEIRYIDSPKDFYVQKVDNIPAFEKLMDDMFLYYNKNQNVPNHLALGAPCIVKYDNEWYRAEVMRADCTAIIVRHVDFGYEQKVTKNLLSTIAEKHLKLPRQAVQCCLKGFENNELSKDLATTQFEMLAEESNRQRRSFTVKVFRIHPDGVNLVNLCTKDLNVMKKLYKLSMPFEQYLTLEKEDFNLHAVSGFFGQNGSQKMQAENDNKTPSIASSTEMASINSSKKGNILNSTTLHSEELRVQHKEQQQKSNRNNNGSNQNYVSSVSNTEWDKQSSNSSVTTENRDSRSSSSEFKQQQLGQQRKQNYYKNYPSNKQQQQQQYIASSNTSVSSDKRSSNSNYCNQRLSSNPNTPPRFLKQQQNKPIQQYPQQNSPRKQKQQQQQNRPQNAPQGFAQQANQNDSNLLNNSNNSIKSFSTNSEASKKSLEVTIKNQSDNASTPSLQQHPKEKAVSETFVPLNRAFPIYNLDVPCRKEIIISWWISPHQFYTQLKSRSAEFERFMKDIQQFYHKLPLQPLQLKVGSFVMARQRRDNIIYRARITACNQMLRKYRVHFVDFGNQYTVTSEDIWQVEKRFADFPIMAYLCGFDSIVSNYDHLYIIDRMDKYLPQGVTLQCEYIEKNKHDLYSVNVKVNNTSLKQILCKEGLITDICPELRLDLLAGQQIRGKIISINSMLNFKIQVPFYGCDKISNIEMLCSYDDVRYVKSNQDIARKFKQFYDGKSCVVNIKDVNDNKVLLLRPLMPLLKEDIPWNICTPPILLESFNVRIAYVATPYRLFGQIVATEMEMAQLLDDMFTYYENEGTELDNFELEQVCAAKGSDGNWYRARIKYNQNAEGPFVVNFFDYGNTESIDKHFLKKLEDQFYLNRNAYAIEINLPLKTLSADVQQKQKGRKSADNNTSAGTANESDIAVIKKLSSMTLDQEISVKCLEVKNNHLIGDLIMPDGKNIIDFLKEQKLIKSRDLEFIRKLLEKEKPNVLEYIECVDLTLEDEEDGNDDKSKTGNRIKPVSPKKKKTNNKNIEMDKKIYTVSLQQEEIKVTNIPPAAHEKSKEIIEIAAPKVFDEKVKEPTKTIEKENPVEVRTFPKETVELVPATEPEVELETVNPYADMEHGILAHCDNPAQFFIHPADKVKYLQRLQENLQIVASSLPPLMRIINGAYCISMYSVDKQWYRAKILDAELMVLQFIDYGNTDCVTDTTDLKEMIVFPEVEPLCTPCALPIRPNGTIDWQDAANATFNDSYNKGLDYEFITRGEQFKKSYVNLYIEGVNIMEKLIKDGYAKPLEIVDSGENCYISHVNSITDFYIQYEKDSKGLELIEIYLADYKNLKKLEKFEKFKIVAALFPDDEMWYRAKMLKQEEGGFEVLFIDYGNTSISPECREISQEIAELPPLSKKCALEVPTHCTSWSDAAEQKFMEIADTGETIFSVELREPSQNHAIVHLLIDGHNINDDLGDLCDKKPESELCAEMNSSCNNSTLHNSVYESGTLYEAIISHVNSPCDFYIQFAKDIVRLEDMTLSLNTMAMEKLENPLKMQLCAAVYPEDSKLYRAKILEVIDINEFRVLFVDYGNEAVTTELKTLPEDLMELKEFSKKCQLENALKFSQFGSIATESFNNLISQCEGLVKIDIINEGVNNQPAIVKAFSMNTEENLCENLNKLLGLDHKTQTLTISPQIDISVEENLEKAAKTCIISHAISPSHFYIQLKSNSDKMETIKNVLANLHAGKETPQKLQQTDVGTKCSAYSAEDDCFYRGRIEKALGDNKGYEIFLLDYGNNIITQEIRELPQELGSIPSMALKCRLNSIPSGVCYSLLEERFSALLETHFGEVYEIQQDEIDDTTHVHTVKLQVNYKDLAEELKKAVESNTAVEEVFSPLPTLYDCSIIHVNSPTSFYVQLTKDVSQLEHITDVLLDAETEFTQFTELQVGAICAAQFPEDLAYYRAEIVDLLEDNKCEVHYIDFGNNSVTDKFYKLPKELLKLERCSKKCSLDSTWPQTPEMLQHFSQFVDIRFSETFQLEFLKTSETLNIVRLFYQEKNIIQEILQIIKNNEVDGDAVVDGGIASRDINQQNDALSV